MVEEVTLETVNEMVNLFMEFSGGHGVCRAAQNALQTDARGIVRVEWETLTMGGGARYKSTICLKKKSRTKRSSTNTSLLLTVTLSLQSSSVATFCG